MSKMRVSILTDVLFEICSSSLYDDFVSSIIYFEDTNYCYGMLSSLTIEWRVAFLLKAPGDIPASY